MMRKSAYLGSWKKEMRMPPGSCVRLQDERAGSVVPHPKSCFGLYVQCTRSYSI